MFRTQLSPRNLSYELPFSSVAVAGQTCSPFFPVKKTQISAFLERFLHVLGTHRVTSGWWGLPKPLWKMMEWKSVGMIIHSQYDGKVIIHSCSKPPTSLFCCWLHPLCLMVYPCFVHWIRCFLLLPPFQAWWMGIHPTTGSRPLWPLWMGWWLPETSLFRLVTLW